MRGRVKIDRPWQCRFVFFFSSPFTDTVQTRQRNPFQGTIFLFENPSNSRSAAAHNQNPLESIPFKNHHPLTSSSRYTYYPSFDRPIFIPIRHFCNSSFVFNSSDTIHIIHHSISGAYTHTHWHTHIPYTSHTTNSSSTYAEVRNPNTTAPQSCYT